jgi:hypothetical protein
MPSVSQVTATRRQDRELMQKAFYQGPLNVAKLCAVKGKRVSDVKNCNLFGLRLGMTLDEAKQIIGSMLPGESYQVMLYLPALNG